MRLMLSWFICLSHSLFLYSWASILSLCCHSVYLQTSCLSHCTPCLPFVPFWWHSANYARFLTHSPGPCKHNPPPASVIHSLSWLSTLQLLFSLCSSDLVYELLMLLPPELLTVCFAFLCIFASMSLCDQPFLSSLCLPCCQAMPCLRLKVLLPLLNLILLCHVWIFELCFWFHRVFLKLLCSLESVFTWECIHLATLTLVFYQLITLEFHCV